MYPTRPSIIYGFHGSDQKLVEKIVLLKEKLKPSSNNYDWLGHGMYFWENNLERAKQYAVEDSQRKKSTIRVPSVLGAVIDLGNCLDLLDQKHLDFLKFAYEEMSVTFRKKGITLPQNKQFGKNDFDFKARELDCAVIQHALALAKAERAPFDSVHAAFSEGEEVYPGAYIKEKNHIQLAVINPKSIKALFLPQEISF